MEECTVVGVECWGIPCKPVQQWTVEQWLSFPENLRHIHVVDGQNKAMNDHKLQICTI